ncbi:MAG TPA: hydantoinase/oxoprolinase family protein [Gemmatimonadales bacterium]|nr:hydantoinase/oxoprolinase family protein [Gemmatimonadales bacterium]
MSGVLGWDVGGVNTKAARVADARILAARAVPYEIQRDPAALAPLLARLAHDLDSDREDAHAVTMTAELSQLFRTKREGVGFVLDAVAAAFPAALVRVWSVDARWRTPAEARREPLAVAAANWAATARVVGRLVPDCLLIDVGSTTTDVIPIVGGAPATSSQTDMDRLREGELVYTGALRTPIEAIAPTVPVRGRAVAVSAEGFALAGDAHLWRGELEPADYSVPTPDGRPATKDFAGERLARMVCADREMLDDGDLGPIADAVREAQVERIGAAVDRQRACHPGLRHAVVTGLGDFLAAAAARRSGLQVVHLADRFGPAARHAPAAAVALLFPS